MKRFFDISISLSALLLLSNFEHILFRCMDAGFFQSFLHSYENRIERIYF